MIKQLEKESSNPPEVSMTGAKEMESLGNLAATLAHEFNNILMPVIAYPELMLRDLPEDSPYVKQLVEIREAGERAFTIVQELCELNHRDELMMDAVRPDQIIREFLCSNNFKMLERQYEVGGVEQRFDAGELLVSGSSRSISLVVGKMLFHAARRMPAGDAVEIATGQGDPLGGYGADYVHISVTDHGAPMNRDEINVAFEAHPCGQELLGLGLPVLYGMVKNLNGHVRLTSDDAGTQLTVFLPIYHPHGRVAASRAPAAPIRSGKILVVDDMPRQRDMAARYLVSFGYEVDAVANGDEALNYLSEQTPSLVMLDMIMPGFRDGLDTYLEMAERHPDVPVILCSGYGSNERIIEALEHGARDYIQKPYVLDHLGRIVKQYVSSCN